MRKRSYGGVTIFSLDAEGVLAAVRRLVAAKWEPDGNVAGVVLFGSFARGDAVPGSDVDLLVVLERDARQVRDRILDHLPSGLGVGADVIPWTWAEILARVEAGDRFARTILREGEILLDRDGRLARLRARAAAGNS